MGKGTFIPELPYETLVRKTCGSQWRHLSDAERDGAFGVAIVKSVSDGVEPDLNEIASHLGVERDLLVRAFRRLSLNGIFRRDWIYDDRALQTDDQLAWCYYAGYASGATGLVGLVN
jgi:hypothetical protein